MYLPKTIIVEQMFWGAVTSDGVSLHWPSIVSVLLHFFIGQNKLWTLILTVDSIFHNGVNHQQFLAFSGL
jgi:hypothetical protein